MHLPYLVGLPFVWLLLAKCGRGYFICKDCRSPEQMVAPGIGFDITHSYGTAAIRFQNGSNVFVGRIDGDEAYIAMMEYRSTEESRPEEPHDFWSDLRYRYAQEKRRVNKALGRPATEEVGNIANLVLKLRTMVEERLGEPITSAIVSRPRLPGFHYQDMADVMEYLNLTRLTSYRQWGDVTENQVVFAADGRGLCSCPEDIRACDLEDQNLPFHSVASFTFTQSCLSLSLGSFRDAYTNGDYVANFYPNLGLGHIGDYPNPGLYWREMKDTMKDFFTITQLGFDVMQLFGEAAGNETFSQTIKDAMMEMDHFNQKDHEKLRLVSDPEQLAALGTAELAKRFQVMTWGCVESVKCNPDPDQEIAEAQAIFNL